MMNFLILVMPGMMFTLVFSTIILVVWGIFYVRATPPFRRLSDPEGKYPLYWRQG